MNSVLTKGTLTKSQEFSLHQVKQGQNLGISIKLPEFRWSSFVPINGIDQASYIYVIDDKNRKLKIKMENR